MVMHGSIMVQWGYVCNHKDSYYMYVMKYTLMAHHTHLLIREYVTTEVTTLASQKMYITFCSVAGWVGRCCQIFFLQFVHIYVCMSSLCVCHLMGLMDYRTPFVV